MKRERRFDCDALVEIRKQGIFVTKLRAMSVATTSLRAAEEAAVLAFRFEAIQAGEEFTTITVVGVKRRDWVCIA